MAKKRKFYQLILANILLISFFALFVTFMPNNSLTGEAISLSAPTTCDQAYFEDAWNLIFKSVFDGTNFSSSTSGTPDCIVAGYDFSNEIMRYLYLEQTTSVHSEDYEYTVIIANLTSEGLTYISDKDVLDEDDFDGDIASYVENRSSNLDSEPAGLAEINNWVLLNPSSLTEEATQYTYSDLSTDSSPQNGDIYYNNTGLSLIRNESYLGYYDWFSIVTNETYWATINILANISNQEFVKGSTWNTAVDLDDISDNFYGTQTVTISSNLTGNGTLESKVAAGNLLQFESDDDGWGTWEIDLVLSNLGTGTSQTLEFNVSIPETQAPTEIEEFDTFLISQGDTETFDLTDYFEDLDDDDLTYTVTVGDHLTIELTGDDLDVTASETFEGKSWIKIIASDGTFNVSSGTVTVYIGVPYVSPTTEGSTSTTSNTSASTTSIEILNSSKTNEIKLGPLNEFTLFVEANDTEGKNLTYVWYVNNEKIEGTLATNDFSGLDPGDYEIRVEISNGNETEIKTWSVSIGGQSVSYKKWLFIGAGVLFIVALIISIIIITKDMKKKKVANAQQEPITPNNLGNQVPEVPTNQQTNQQTSGQTDPVQDYLKKINS